MTDIFTAPDSTSQQMADAIPIGRAWGKKNVAGSNTRLLIDSLAVAHNRVQQQVELLAAEFEINNAVALLPEWETSVGLPDDGCGTSTTQTTQQRRDAVIERLRKVPTVTLAEMQAYLDRNFTDVPVTLYAGEDYYATGAKPEKFMVVAEMASTNNFEYEFEMEFIIGSDTTRLSCVMDRILPGNVILRAVFV